MTGILKGVFLAAALVAVAGCGGCGGDKDKKDKDGAAPKKGDGAAAKGAPAGGGEKYDAAKSTASVKITIKWTGAKPPQVPVPITEPTCKTPNPVMNERFVVNDDGGLPNAFVWAKDGPHKKMSGFPASPALVLDQKGCMYVPHVFGIRVDEAFTVKNSDGTKHNVHSHPKGSNKPINVPQDPGSTSDFTYTEKEMAVAFNCDVHSWMNAYGFVLDHPFYGVSNSSGAIEIKGLPAGTYTFKAWHEQFSGDKAYEGETPVTLKDGESQNVTIEMKPAK